MLLFQAVKVPVILWKWRQTIETEGWYWGPAQYMNGTAAAHLAQYLAASVSYFQIPHSVPSCYTPGHPPMITTLLLYRELGRENWFLRSWVSWLLLGNTLVPLLASSHTKGPWRDFAIVKWTGRIEIAFPSALCMCLCVPMCAYKVEKGQGGKDREGDCNKCYAGWWWRSNFFGG